MCVCVCVRVRVCRMELQEAKKIADMKKREKMEERLARCVYIVTTSGYSRSILCCGCMQTEGEG